MEEINKDLDFIISDFNPIGRKRKLTNWLEKSLASVKQSQAVIDTSILTRADIDFTIEHLTKLCVQELLDKNLISVQIEKNKISCKLTCFIPKRKKSMTSVGFKVRLKDGTVAIVLRASDDRLLVITNKNEQKWVKKEDVTETYGRDD